MTRMRVNILIWREFYCRSPKFSLRGARHAFLNLFLLREKNSLAGTFLILHRRSFILQPGRRIQTALAALAALAKSEIGLSPSRHGSMRVRPRRGGNFAPRTGSWRQQAAEVFGEDAMAAFSDHGDGIPESQRQLAFEPFWRKQSAGKCSGLGLAIAKELIEQQGRRIWIKETPGGEATFKVASARQGDLLSDRNFPRKGLELVK